MKEFIKVKTWEWTRGGGQIIITSENGKQYISQPRQLVTKKTYIAEIPNTNPKSRPIEIIKWID